MPTLKEALHYFLLEERRPKTQALYRNTLAELIRAIGPDREIARIQFEDLADYFARRRDVDQLKPATLLTYIAITKAFFNWTAAHRYVAESPAKHLKRRAPAHDPARDRAVPTDELERMAAYARVTNPRNHALLLFLIDTGCRAGGAASLRRATLDLTAGTAILDEKGGKRFKARFGAETATALRRWLELRPPADHDQVWTGKKPRYLPLSAQAISQVVQSLARHTGASREWGAHSIRHAVGHAYAEAGLPPTVTQQKLGHSDVLVTLTHYYPDSEAYVDAVSRAHPLLALKPPVSPEPEAPKLLTFPKSG